MTTADLLTTAQVAGIKKVSERTVARWVQAGKLTAAVKLPGPRGAYLFLPADIEAAS